MEMVLIHNGNCRRLVLARNVFSGLISIIKVVEALIIKDVDQRNVDAFENQVLKEGDANIASGEKN